MPVQAVRAGDIAFARMEKVNAELLALTYGAVVSELLRSVKETHQVEHELEKMGHNMGVRLIDEYLAKTTNPACQSFKDVMESLSRIGAKMFLGIDADVSEISSKSFLLSFPENPLNDFVQLPPTMKDFSYSSLYCGIIKGALEQIHLKVDCKFTKDILRGDDTNSIQVDLVGVMRPDDDEDD